MDELIYRFLLQSGFPRAAVVTDLSLLPLAAGPDGAGANGTGERRPSFAIVDPDTGDRLALVDVCDALDGDGLRAAAGTLGGYARRFGGRSVQGFLVRVDAAASAADERVQFYRVWPGETLEQVSAKAFPDLASMRTWQLLAGRRDRGPARTVSRGGDIGAAARSARAAAFGDGDGDPADDVGGVSSVEPRPARRPGFGAWLPGLALAALAVTDVVLARDGGAGLLSPVQALLAIGAAALLLVPMLGRRG